MIRKTLITFFVLIMVTGCSNTIAIDSLLEYDMDEIEKQVNEYTEYYFSKDSQSLIKQTDDIHDGIFSSVLALKNLQQKSIKHLKNTCYRYLCVKEGGLPTACILIEYKDIKHGGKMTLFQNSKDEAFIGESSKMYKTKYKLNPSQIKDFEEAIQPNTFQQISEAGTIFGDDGGYELVEGIKNGQYHFIIRWSGDKDKNVQSLFDIFTSFLSLK